MTKPTDEPWYVDEERKALITYHGFHGRQMPDPMGAKHREREAELKRAADEPDGLSVRFPGDEMKVHHWPWKNFDPVVFPPNWAIYRVWRSDDVLYMITGPSLKSGESL